MARRPLAFSPALEAAAPSVGVRLVQATVHDKAEIQSAIAALADDLTAGLVIMPDVFTAGHRAMTILARDRVPTIYGPRFTLMQVACFPMAPILSSAPGFLFR